MSETPRALARSASQASTCASGRSNLPRAAEEKSYSSFKRGSFLPAPAPGRPPRRTGGARRTPAPLAGAGWGGGSRRTQIAESSIRGLNSVSLTRIVSSTPSRLQYTSSLVKRRMSNPSAASVAERAASRAISSSVECVAPSTSTMIRASRQAKSTMRRPRMTWRRNRKPATCSRRRPLPKPALSAGRVTAQGPGKGRQ